MTVLKYTVCCEVLHPVIIVGKHVDPVCSGFCVDEQPVTMYSSA